MNYCLCVITRKKINNSKRIYYIFTIFDFITDGRNNDVKLDPELSKFQSNYSMQTGAYLP